MFVLLGGSTPQTNQAPNIGVLSDQSELVEELRDRVRYLERQVEEEREARRRADTILAQLSRANEEQARTIRAIEAPSQEPTSEPPGASTEATEQPGRVEPQAQVEGQQTPDTRPWWQRWFGG